ncbi:MAG TPA: endonuclease/exonuclease/phosphatase family protein [Bacteroidales bacterium]|nr:endonuclease/exonuclease/phosphatase family protein [Bacteroidales bacterium]
MLRSSIIGILLTILLVSCRTEESSDIDVITFNIRLDTPRDSINAWPNRAPLVTGFINDQIPDLLGMQEVLWHQYRYLDSALIGYGSVAAGRDDGMQQGEACPVFYRLGRFSPVASGTFWLSATPEVPGSVGWGAALTRIATWVRLYDKTVKDTLLYMNTHFDHISDSARVMSSGVLLEKLRELAGENNFVITGDFNAPPESLAIARMTEGGYAVDSYTVSETAPAGETYTFNGWKDTAGDNRIDYVFIRNGMKVISHETFRVIEEGVFISDHWPVKARIRQ